MNAISPSNPDQRLRKPRLLVVDDEPDNLDLLYRTFRREYQVLRAESGTKALDILKDNGEVAVIISDQRMPEMTGTEFFSKTVPDFPDTVRIILTGFTDVEDLVQAINNGQVYRYITKPWDPLRLKAVVQQATDTYVLLKQSNYELDVAKRQADLMARVAQLANLDVTEGEALQFIADGWGQILSASLCAIQAIDTGRRGATVVYGDFQGQSLDSHPLVQAAIATRTIQAAPDVSRDDLTSDFYEITATQSHLVLPVVFKDRLLAVVSLQWHQRYRTLDSVIGSLSIAISQLAQALIAIRYR
ncbi:MAG: response regulator [Cyanobacteria bacterium P01_A01_bin.15]